MKSQNYNLLKKLLSGYSIAGVIMIVFGVVLILIPAIPTIWYSFDKDATRAERESIIDQVEAAEKDREDLIDNLPPAADPELPPLDTNLPKENTLTISKIGVNGVIHTGPNAIKELDKGIWLTYGWGTPEENNIPIVIAAHRFGYLYWSSDFRKTQSFYNLPSLNVGDRIEIVWNQRKYEYEVYRAYEGTDFENLEGDLILYTCKLFNSPDRVFRYARRIN